MYGTLNASRQKNWWKKIVKSADFLQGKVVIFFSDEKYEFFYDP